MNSNNMNVLIGDGIQFSPGYGCVCLQPSYSILLSGEKQRRKHGKKLHICALTYRQKKVLRIIKDFRKINL